jgi:hypothetical protein
VNNLPGHFRAYLLLFNLGPVEKAHRLSLPRRQLRAGSGVSLQVSKCVLDPR